MCHQPLKLSLLIALLSASCTSVAEDAPPRLPTMVVSAAGYQQQTLLAPATVSVIEVQQLSQPSASLAEALRDIPGVTLSDASTPGLKRLSLRGEKARRVLIKINGQPLADHSNYGTPLLIDLAMVERVEIVRGAASVVHGSNAIGGVVNIITRQLQPGDQQLLLSSGYYSASRGRRLAAAALTATEHWDGRLEASRNNHNDQLSASGRLRDTASEQQAVAGEIGYRLNSRQRLSLQADYFDSEASAWVEQNPGVDHLRFPQRSAARTALSYQYQNDNAILQRLTARLYQHRGRRRFNTAISSHSPTMSVAIDNYSDDTLLTDGVQLATESSLLAAGRTLWGLEYQHDELDSDKKTVTRIQNSLPMPPSGTTEKTSQQLAEQRLLSAYVQQQLTFSPQLEAHIGSRLYQIRSRLIRSTERSRSDKQETQTVASAALVWLPQPDLALRSNIAQGYSYPSLTQQFSVTSGGSDVHFGNPQLEAEQSTTIELGLRLENHRWSLDLSGYHSVARNYIDRQALTAVPDEYSTDPGARKRLWRWVNVNKANNLGLETSLMYVAPSTRLRPYLYASMQRRELEFANGYHTSHSGLPGYQLRTGMQWDLSGQLTLDGYLSRYGDASRRDNNGQQSEHYGAYTSFTLTAQYQPSAQLSVNAALRNLTNIRYQNPEELPAAGRAVDAELHWRF